MPPVLGVLYWWVWNRTKTRQPADDSINAKGSGAEGD
jgi:hypothetical protein